MNPANRETFLLSIDLEAGRVTRYRHVRGFWGGQRMERAELPEDGRGYLGDPGMVAVLMRFRMTGKPE